MARSFREAMPGRDAWRRRALYVILAVAVFAVVVSLLFRERFTGPKDTSASDTPVTQGAVNPVAVEGQPTRTPSPALETLNQTSPQAEAALAQAMALVRAQPRQVVEARNKLNGALQTSLTPEQHESIKSEMAKLASEWLFGPAAFAGDTLCDTYLVKRGDLLERHRTAVQSPL